MSEKTLDPNLAFGFSDPNDTARSVTGDERDGTCAIALAWGGQGWLWATIAFRHDGVWFSGEDRAQISPTHLVALPSPPRS